jgi:hypothetical protein
VGSLAREIRALETTEKVIAALALSAERDAVIDRLLAAIDQDRAALLATMLTGHARGRPSTFPQRHPQTR